MFSIKLLPEWSFYGIEEPLRLAFTEREGLVDGREDALEGAEDAGLLHFGQCNVGCWAWYSLIGFSSSIPGEAGKGNACLMAASLVGVDLLTLKLSSNCIHEGRDAWC
jgi:hypothetical protein